MVLWMNNSHMIQTAASNCGRYWKIKYRLVPTPSYDRNAVYLEAQMLEKIKAASMQRQVRMKPARGKGRRGPGTKSRFGYL